MAALLCVLQRKDYSALIKFLPPKYEYILGVKLGELQVKLYQRYLDMLKGDKLGESFQLTSPCSLCAVCHNTNPH